MVVTGTHFGFLKEKNTRIFLFYFNMYKILNVICGVESRDEIFSMSVFENSKKQVQIFL